MLYLLHSIYHFLKSSHLIYLLSISPHKDLVCLIHCWILRPRTVPCFIMDANKYLLSEWVIVNNVKPHWTTLENWSSISKISVTCLISEASQRSSTDSFLHSFQWGKTKAWGPEYGESLFRVGYFFTEQELEARAAESQGSLGLLCSLWLNFSVGKALLDYCSGCNFPSP